MLYLCINLIKFLHGVILYGFFLIRCIPCIISQQRTLVAVFRKASAKNRKQYGVVDNQNGLHDVHEEYLSALS